MLDGRRSKSKNIAWQYQKYKPRQTCKPIPLKTTEKLQRTQANANKLTRDITNQKMKTSLQKLYKTHYQIWQDNFEGHSSQEITKSPIVMNQG